MHYFDTLFLIFYCVLALLLIVRLALQFEEFRRELHYLKEEIRRTAGRERRLWQLEKRRLWFSLIPFYRK